MAKPNFARSDLAYKGKDGKFYKVKGVSLELEQKVEKLDTSSDQYKQDIETLKQNDAKQDTEIQQLQQKDQTLESTINTVKDDLANFRKGIESRVADVDYSQTGQQATMPVGIYWKVPQTKDGTFIQINPDTGKPQSGNWDELYQYHIYYKKDAGSAVVDIGVEKVLPQADGVFKVEFVDEVPEESLFKENTQYVIKQVNVVP